MDMFKVKGHSRQLKKKKHLKKQFVPNQEPILIYVDLFLLADILANLIVEILKLRNTSDVLQVEQTLRSRL